jgi:hypothetical protein
MSAATMTAVDAMAGAAQFVADFSIGMRGLLSRL